MSGDHQGSLDDSPWDADEWAEWRRTVTDEVRLHGDALSQVVEILADEGEGGPLHWETMSPARRALVMGKLADFVGFLDRTYFQYLPDFNLKPCWWLHPDVVWQLTALWAAFQTTYRPSARPGNEQAAWHLHVLWPTLERLRKSSLRPCNATEHKPEMQRPLGEAPGLKERLEQWRNDEDIPLGEAPGDRHGGAPDADSMRDVDTSSDAYRGGHDDVDHASGEDESEPVDDSPRGVDAGADS